MSVPGLRPEAMGWGQWVGLGSRLQALGGGCWAQGRNQCPDNAGFQSPESGVLHVWGPSVGKQTKEQGAGLQPGADQLNTLMACSRGAGVVVYIPETEWWPYAGIYVYPKHQSS